MAVSRVNTNTMAFASASPATGNFAINATTDFAVIAIAYDSAAGMSVTGVTLGGVACTPAGVVAHNATSNAYCELWYLVAPTIGASVALSISLVLGTGTDVYYNVIAFKGVNALAPIRPGTTGSATGNSTAPALTVTSNLNDLTVTVIDTGGSTPTATNQTSDGLNSSGGFGAGSDHATTAAGSVTHTWTTSAATQWCIAGLSLNGDAAAGGAWAPKGTRQVPGQRGPFDPLGFLLQRKLDYTPAPATTFVPFFLPPPAFVMGRTRSERTARHQFVAHGHLTTGAPLLRPNRSVTQTTLLLARNDQERELVRATRSRGRVTTLALAAPLSPVLPRFADLAPPILLEARTKGAKRLRQLFDRDHHWIMASRLLAERWPILPRFADLAPATILLTARTDAVHRLRQLLASHERIVIARWLPPPIPPAPILNHGALLLARDRGARAAHVRHEKNRSTLATWLPYRRAPILTPPPLWWRQLLEENRSRGVRRLKLRHDAADVFAFAYLPAPKPPPALRHGLTVRGRVAGEHRLRIRRLLHELFLAQLPLPIPRPPRLGRMTLVDGRAAGERPRRLQHARASVHATWYVVRPPAVTRALLSALLDIFPVFAASLEAAAVLTADADARATLTGVLAADAAYDADLDALATLAALLDIEPEAP